MAEPDANDPFNELRQAVLAVAEEAAPGAGVASRIALDPASRPEFGDYSTNAAMLLAPVAGAPPRDVAAGLAEKLASLDGVATAEVAGPGFVNLFLEDTWHRRVIADVVLADEDFGRPGGIVPERIGLEFVSANPTGPLTAAGGRHAAYGDSLARVLEQCGHTVEREYFINDAGGQIARFAASISARMRGEEPPEDGYAGDYIAELGEMLAADGVAPDDIDRLGQLGVNTLVHQITRTLMNYRVQFDIWFSERSLHESGQVERAIATLRDSGHVYESEGAVWLRTTTFGDDKDRVLVKADGEPTYFAADVAYHADKLSRGYDRIINVFGADHHGYVERMKAAMATLGAEADSFEIEIMQLVNIIESGERAQMSKRKGEFVTLDELIADIGIDAARYFMVQRGNDTTVDLDLDLARSASQENPVYYVQYAHARIAAIMRKAEAEGVHPAGIGAAVDGVPVHESERALVRRILELPTEVALAAERRAPHRLCSYATSLAADFHAFYRDCQVVGVEEPLQTARLSLCVAVRRTLATSLRLIGVDAPERM